MQDLYVDTNITCLARFFFGKSKLYIVQTLLKIKLIKINDLYEPGLSS